MRGTASCGRWPSSWTFGQRSSADTSVCAGPTSANVTSGMPRRDADDQLLIDPLMQAAEVADDRPRQRREIGRRRIAGLAHAIEALEVDAERKQVDVRADARGALAAASPT